MLRFNKLSGFTIAEIIITIGIIGIVAELTIPSLIKTTERQIILSRVKEAYSIFSQATNQLNYECGGDIAGCVESPTAATDNDDTARVDLTNHYKAKLNLSKDCTDGSDGCVPTVGYQTLYPGAVWVNVSTNGYYKNSKFLLANGMSVAFRYHGMNLPLQYIVIQVDINGLANPNQLGKDYFYFNYDITKRLLVPAPSADCVSAVAPNYGTGCASRVLNENAINYY